MIMGESQNLNHLLLWLNSCCHTSRCGSIVFNDLCVMNLKFGSRRLATAEPSAQQSEKLLDNITSERRLDVRACLCVCERGKGM